MVYNIYGEHTVGIRKNKSDLILELEHDVLIDKREIWLTNKHLEASDINPLTATQFIKNLRLLDGINNEPIIINLCAGLGGDIDAGMIIFDAISQCKSHVTMVVHGCAASMSSIILQSADTRIMSPSAYIMIHYGFIYMDGQGALAAKSFMEKLLQDGERDINIYVNRCKNAEYFKGWKDSKIKKFIKDKLNYKEDWYLSAKDSILYGFACGILGEPGFESI